ncbi:uncharacterized protein LOC107769574 [Nicotiana tabacum]|uniref:Uncharacterized protein LOC107769574 n=1 Tax=Nicotiana tabacum TaxID=4097 RepID=A0AC58S6Z3_TOBAC
MMKIGEFVMLVVTAIGLISEGCSKALLQEMRQLVETVVMLIHDPHPRVHWATIHAIGQLSKYLSPHFQEQYHQQILPALLEVLDDFDNPRLQRGMTMMKEAALATLAFLAISSQEDSAYIYDSIMPHLKVILVTATMITAMAVGNLAILDYVEKVTSAVTSLQETHMEVEDPMRSLLLQAWGRLCKCLGADFLPYLSVSMPVVLKSAQLKNYLSVSNNSDTEDSDDESMIKVTSGNKKIGIRSALLEEKALACHILCCFAAEVKKGLHLWVNEVVSALVPNLTFKSSEEVRMAAISAMPLLLHSVAFAVRKGLPVTGCGKPPVQKLFDSIIPALLDALQKESKVQIQARLLDAFNESIQSNDRTAEERRIVVHLFCDVAEQCREDAFRYYEEWIPLLLRVYDHNNPDVQQLVATAVGICAEFGGDILKPHTIVIFNHLKSVMEHPNAKCPDNIMAYEAAISTCGKLSQFVWEGIYTYKFILLWLSHLPIRCNLDEAKVSHELLCSVMETSREENYWPSMILYTENNSNFC